MASFLDNQTYFYLLCVFLAALVYYTGLALYRITFHPLANIPGPKLAAITQFYQTFYCYYNGESRFYKQVEYLHSIYGPVVRITPEEVSLNDPENYETIYHIGTKYYKSPSYYGVFGAPDSAFTTVHNKLHSQRRAALNPFFSRKAVLKLENVVQEKAQRLADRLETDLAKSSSVDLHNLFSALSVDVASDYVYHDCYDLLKKPETGKEFVSMVRGILQGFWFFLQSHLVEAIVLGAPNCLSELSPVIKKYNTLVRATKKNVIEVKAQIDAGLTGHKLDRISIFHQLLDPNAAEGHVVPSVDQLVDNALSIIVAAAAATGNAMTMISYHVLRNPEILNAMREEIIQAFPDEKQQMDFATLEKLPYLTGVVKEGLRLSYGVIGRLPRVVPEPGAVFNGHFLPANSVVGMSSWTMHRQPHIFTEPDKFDPMRWYDPVKARPLHKYLVAFGKDSRQCIGMPLAYCEIYVTIAKLFRRFEHLELVGVTPEDMVYDDYFSSYHPENARGIEVKLSTPEIRVVPNGIHGFGAR